MHGRLSAPLGGEAADCFVDIFAEAQEIADYAPIQEGAVRVGVCEVGGQTDPCRGTPRICSLRREQLFIGEAAEVQGRGETPPQ